MNQLKSRTRCHGPAGGAVVHPHDASVMEVHEPVRLGGQLGGMSGEENRDAELSAWAASSEA